MLEKHIHDRIFSSGSRGYTIIEVVCALAVVTIVTLGVIGSLVSTLKIDDEASVRFEVENVALACMEEYLAKPFGELAPGVMGPTGAGNCIATVTVYELAPGGPLMSPIYGIEVNVRDSQNAQISTMMVGAKTRHTF